MSLAGRGAVAIWHDIAPEGRAEFYAWHGEQHMPERAGVPGFLRGRRYVAQQGTPEFFNLYETTSPAVLSGADYLQRLNHPTPWTVATVRHFRNVARSLCAVAATHGDGDGGLMATFRYALDARAGEAHRRRISPLLAGLAREPGVAGVHLLVADEAASAIETAERKARAAGTDIPGWIVLVEGWGDGEPFAQRCARLAGDDLFREAQPGIAWALYRLQNTRMMPGIPSSGTTTAPDRTTRE